MIRYLSPGSAAGQDIRHRSDRPSVTLGDTNRTYMLTSRADRWPAAHRCIAGKPTCIIRNSMRQHGQWTKSDVLPSTNDMPEQASPAVVSHIAALSASIARGKIADDWTRGE